MASQMQYLWQSFAEEDINNMEQLLREIKESWEIYKTTGKADLCFYPTIKQLENLEGYLHEAYELRNLTDRQRLRLSEVLQNGPGLFFFYIENKLGYEAMTKSRYK